MNLEHAIIALAKEVHALAEKVDLLTGRVSILEGKVDFLTEQVNRHSEILERHSGELRHHGVMLEHLDAKIELLIDGYGALDKKIEDFRGEVNEKFKEIDYKFETVFEDVGILRKEFYAFCHG